jgi:hypothetical protein
VSRIPAHERSRDRFTRTERDRDGLAGAYRPVEGHHAGIGTRRSGYLAYGAAFAGAAFAGADTG